MTAQIYYRETSPTRGTIVAISPTLLRENDIPEGCKNFAISRGELDMFQRGLVAVSNWTVLIDPKTKTGKLVKLNETTRYENVRMLTEIVGYDSPEVSIVIRNSGRSDYIYLARPGPSWTIPDKKSSIVLEFFLTLPGDPNVLIASKKIPVVDLFDEVPLHDKPISENVMILTSGGYRCGVIHD